MDRARDHVARMREAGLAITGPLAEFRVPVSVSFPEDLDGEYERILLCVKAQDTEAATRLIAPHLATDGYIVSVQNGLNELDIACDSRGRAHDRVFRQFRRGLLSPGVVQYAGRGAVVLGEINGAITERVRALLPLFRIFDERAMLTDNIWGYLWSKEAYGALLFATALTNESIADCLALPRYRQLFVSLAREVLGVAAIKGIRCEPFDGFIRRRFRATSTDEEAADSLDRLVAHNRRSVKTHSGIWRDLAVRKRRTEVDAQLGAVVREAEACGIEDADHRAFDRIDS